MINAWNMAQRIALLASGSTFQEMKAIINSLKELETSMAELKKAAEADDSDSMLLEARQESDIFIKDLLESDTLKNLVAAFELDTALSAAGKAPAVAAELLTAASEAGLPKLDHSSRIMTLFKVLLPELMTQKGKSELKSEATTIPAEHEQYRDGIVKLLPVSKSVSTNSSSSSASTSSVNNVGQQQQQQQQVNIDFEATAASVSAAVGKYKPLRCSDSNRQAAKNILTLIDALKTYDAPPEYKTAVLAYYIKGRILQAEHRHKGIISQVFGTKSRLVNALEIARASIPQGVKETLEDRSFQEKTSYEVFINAKVGLKAFNV
jgi:hypothetical protein